MYTIKLSSIYEGLIGGANSWKTFHGIGMSKSPKKAMARAKDDILNQLGPTCWYEHACYSIGTDLMPLWFVEMIGPNGEVSNFNIWEK